MVKRATAGSALLFTALIMCQVTTQVQSREPMFVPVPRLDVGPGSSQVVLVDLDRDGRIDLVTRHLLQRRVSVFLGDGQGGFRVGAASPISLNYQPGAIDLADLNGDSVPDLAVSMSERDEVEVFLGNGKGGFARVGGSPFTVSGSREFFTRGVILLDVNNDRRLDIVVPNGKDGSFGILFGNGQGGFSRGPVVRRESSKPQRHAFAFGDLDGDGFIDAVIASRSDDHEPGHIGILRGDGTGAFRETAPLVEVPSGPHFLTLGDMNNDRHPDIVISHSHSGLVSVLLNDGGRFVPMSGSPIDGGTEAFTVLVQDANADGRPDLLMATVDSATVLINGGRNRFVSAPGSPFDAGPGAYRIASADINGDGKLDISTSSFERNTIAILLGR